mgnify:CR=1 FL=1
MSFKIFKNVLTTMTNLGTGSNLGILSDTTLQLKSLNAGANVFLTSNETSITISSTGGGGGIPGSITTTNATPAALITVSTAVDTVYSVDVNIIAANSTTNNGNVFFMKGGYKNVAGILTELTVVNDKLSNIQDVGLVIDLAVSGTDIVVQVQGLAANTINWTGVATIQSSNL